MREKIIKLYQYDELTEEAKEQARQWFSESWPYDDWWEFILEDADSLAEKLGLIIKPHTRQNMRGETINKPGFFFDLRAWQLQYQGYYDYDKTWEDKCKKMYNLDVFKQHSELSKFLREWKRQVLTLQKSAFYGLSLDVDCHRYINVDVRNIYDREVTDKQLRQAEELIELYNDFVLTMLQDEYNYITSDEYIEEAIRINEYEFTEDGKIA